MEQAKCPSTDDSNDEDNVNTNKRKMFSFERSRGTEEGTDCNWRVNKFWRSNAQHSHYNPHCIVNMGQGSLSYWRLRRLLETDFLHTLLRILKSNTRKCSYVWMGVKRAHILYLYCTISLAWGSPNLLLAKFNSSPSPQSYSCVN